jgi:hypothetical protein
MTEDARSPVFPSGGAVRPRACESRCSTPQSDTPCTSDEIPATYQTFRRSAGTVLLVDGMRHPAAILDWTSTYNSRSVIVYLVRVHSICAEPEAPSKAPGVPAHPAFKENIHAKAYRAAGRHGLNWVFMGEQAQPPNTWQLAYGNGRHVAQVHVMMIR